jgi:HK97 family phage prohead protease
MDAPKDDLIRSTAAAVAKLAWHEPDETRTDAGTDGRTMTGYPVVFNQWTEIDSMWEGHFLERIHPGALNRTLKQRGNRVQVQFNHGFDPQIGDKPLGKPTVQETRDYGLYTEVPLSDTSYNDDLIALIRDGALWGQSFRFSVLDEKWDDEPDTSDHNPAGIPERTITEARLYEYGPVTYPAYEATTLGIRSVDAFQEWQRTHNATPLIKYSDTDLGSFAPKGTDHRDTLASSPAKVPGRHLITVGATRRATAINELNRFLEGD